MTVAANAFIRSAASPVTFTCATAVATSSVIDPGCVRMARSNARRRCASGTKGLVVVVIIVVGLELSTSCMDDFVRGFALDALDALDTLDVCALNTGIVSA
jgi:hypothetical protein